MTGHADGSVRFWDASSNCMQALCRLRTQKLFEKVSSGLRAQKLLEKAQLTAEGIEAFRVSQLLARDTKHFWEAQLLTRAQPFFETFSSGCSE